MNRIEEILEKIKDVSNTIKWNDIEYLCKEKEWEIKGTKKGYKIYIQNSVWCLHLEHRTSDKIKFGMIRVLRKVLIKENILAI